MYGDGIGSVEYVEHMGDDLTIVNAARVSLGKKKEELEMLLSLEVAVKSTSK